VTSAVPESGLNSSPNPSTNDGWTRPGVILVATDLTELDRLMPFAFQQASETGARLVLLHVLAAGEGIAVDSIGMPYYDPSGASELAARTLEPWCAEARAYCVTCKAYVREGNASQQILAAVKQFQADRILLGTRSRGRLGKLLIGSVAEHILRSVDIPVMTVGPEAYPPSASESQSDPNRQIVLHATTLKETSRRSAALACQVAASQKAKLILLHVLPPMDEMERKGLPTGLDSAAIHELRLLAAETGTGCCTTIEPRVVHGNPSIEILAEAAESRANQIVLGATMRSAFENLTLERTIYRVLAHARCPVLTLRDPAPEPIEADTDRMIVNG
jgi:nucleotide-binding universal stress UspA family protein